MNSVSIIGRLGRDPELRHTQSGKPVCGLRVAVDDGKDRPPVWLSVSAWGKTAELCNQYLTKGRQVAVEGRLTVREWADRDGNKRTSTEVTAHRVHFLGSPSDGEQRRQRPQRENPPAPSAVPWSLAEMDEDGDE